MDRWTPEIRIDQKYAASVRMAECQRQIRGGRRFPFRLDGTGNHHRFAARAQLGMMQRSGEMTKLLDDHRIRRGSDDQPCGDGWNPGKGILDLLEILV